MEMPRAPGWTVVTPNVNGSTMAAPCSAMPFHSGNGVRPSDYHHHSMASSYPIRGSTPSDIHLSPISNSVNVKCGSSLDSHRYGGGGGGYNSYPLSSYRNNPASTSPSSKPSLPLDIGLRDGRSESRLKDEFSLPPIHTPDSNSSSPSPYSLPPISSMEDGRSTDSAAVLRRLRMDDDDGYNTKADQERTWGRRHSLSIHSSSSPYVFFLSFKFLL